MATVLGAATVAGIHRRRHYKWLEADAEYARAFGEVEQDAADVLEAEARRRAVVGTDKPVYHQGKRVDTMKEYSDTLLIFLMKGARPEKYRERWSGEVSGPGGGAVPFTLSLDTHDRDSD